MKRKLHYQITEYDCGTTCLLNALLFLSEREKIPIQLLKIIYQYTLDDFDDTGNMGNMGTSRKAMFHVSYLINQFYQYHNFPIKVVYFQNKEVTFSKIKKILKQKGCVILRTKLEGEHYILLTDIDDDFIYAFDPYFMIQSEIENPNIIVTQNNFNNRKIRISYFKNEKKDFTLGEKINREMIVFIPIEK